jgi:riboflavin transporter FmnP
MNVDNPTIKLAGAAILAPLAVLLQILPPLFVTPWSMRIDLVAIPLMMCWIIFGLKPALLSLLISAPLIGFLGPFAGGWVGAIMKSVATIWMFLIPGIIAWKTGGTKNLLENKWLFVTASILAIIVRVLVTEIFNFYFALPLFFPDYFPNPEAIINYFSDVTVFGYVGIGSYIIEIAFWNILQGIIDSVAAMILGLLIFRRIPALTSQSKNKQKPESCSSLQ